MTLRAFLLAAVAVCGCGGNPPAPAPKAAQSAPAPPPGKAAEKLAAADALFRARKYTQARVLYEACGVVAERAGQRGTQVEALSQVARCWSLARKLDKGQGWLDLAKALASPDQPLGWTRYLGVRGIFERERGDKPRAKRTFVQMYEYAMERRLHRRAIDAAHHVAIVATPKEQVAWGKQGIAAAEKLGDVGWQAVLWNNLGWTHERQKRYAECLAAYQRARTFHHQGKRELPKLIADWAVGHAYRLHGKLDTAEAWLTKTRAWAFRRYRDKPNPKDAEWIGYCEQDLGEIELTRGRKQAARTRLQRARKWFVEAGMEQHWPKLLEKLDERIALAGSK